MEKKRKQGREDVQSDDAKLQLQQKIDCYSDMLYKIAYLQLKNIQDAEDVVQETFYQFVRTKKLFESTEHEKAWLIKVTINGCRKTWRLAFNRHTDAMPETELAAEGNLEQDALQREKAKEVISVVLSLPRKYREVIHLFYFQSLSIKEICMVTKRKESTVTSQLTRGRELLRKKLGEEYQYE